VSTDDVSPLIPPTFTIRVTAVGTGTDPGSTVPGTTEVSDGMVSVTLPGPHPPAVGWSTSDPELVRAVFGDTAADAVERMLAGKSTPSPKPRPVRRRWWRRRRQ